MVKGLTPKEKRFAEEYLIDLCASAAYRRTGYRSKNPDVDGAKLLVKPSIQEAIQAALAERSKRTEITIDWVVNNLKEVAERCMQKVPVMVFDKAEKTYVQETDPDTGLGVWEFNANGANKSLELLGKHIGMFKEQVDNTGEVKIIIEYADQNS
mgnify:CR=1 FL=1